MTDKILVWLRSIDRWIIIAVLAAVALAGYQLFRILQYNKTRRYVEEFQNSLCIGDKIILPSGVTGIIKELGTTSALILISDNVTVEVERYYITRKYSMRKGGEKIDSTAEN